MLLGILAIVVIALISFALSAAAPPAGTLIVNQASADYNQAGISRTVTSNIVVANVLQVAAVTLEQNNTQYGQTGMTLTFPHKVTNTGNGSDSFDLTAVLTGTQDFALTNITIYPDANNNGIADTGSSPITRTPIITSGQQYSVVVQATIPASATVENSQSQLLVKATSVLDNAVYINNTDTAILTMGAVVTFTKSMSATSGSVGSEHTIIFTYRNSSTTDATNVSFTDVLPAGFTYVSGSANWSQIGNLPDTYTGGGLTFSYSGGTVNANIDTIPAGQEGTGSFKVTVDSNAPAGIISNYATFSYDGAASRNTNIVAFTVLPTIAFQLVGDTVPSAGQGTVVTFHNVLTNTGNTAEVFNVTVDTTSSSFPAGSTYTLYDSADAGVLHDSNGDSIPDTGLLAAGASYSIHLRVHLPAGVSGYGPYSITKVVGSSTNTSLTAIATDTLNEILASSVAVTDSTGTKTADPSDNPNQLKTALPGDTVTYQLKVANSSTIADTYNLTQTLTNAGYTVIIQDVATGQTISNTGIIANGSSKLINLIVTIPDHATPGALNFVFQALSPTTNSMDFINLRLVITGTRILQVSPINTGTVVAGGSKVYSHMITNDGNIDETGITIADINTNGSYFSSLVYADTNNNNLYDAGDTRTNTIGDIAAGDHKTFFVVVISTPNAIEGITNVTTVTASAATVSVYTLTGTLSVTDTTTVSSENITLTLSQRAGISGTYTPNLITRKPGEIIRYKLVVTNNSAAAIATTDINLALPPYTIFNGDGTANTDTGDLVMVRAGGTSIISSSMPYTQTLLNLLPGESVEFYYGVQVTQ